MAHSMRERTSPRSDKEEQLSKGMKIASFLPSFAAEALGTQAKANPESKKDATGSAGALELIQLQVSPWSLRARWALKYHGIPYTASSYTPILGEPWLRLKAGRLLSMQRVTAPILITERDGTLYESFDIAQWADDHSLRGDGARLLPAHQLMDIRRWNDAADSISRYLRKVALEAAQKDEKRKLGLAPHFLLSLPGGRALALGVGDTIIARLAGKYQDTSDASSLEKAQEAMRGFRAALAEAGGQHLLGSFTYADMVFAIVLQALCPPGQPRTLPADRQTVPFGSQELFDEFQDLIPWADGIFDKHFS